MTNREMLELAAKAAGIELKGWTTISGDEEAVIGYDAYSVETWNPLTDDGDALRLAAKLYLWEAIRLAHREVSDTMDIYAATRCAITRAAAEIGKSMEANNA